MGKNPSAFKGDTLPVESVSWNDVQQFIAKLKERSHATYRLPTEAEWEYCCRAESTNLFAYAIHYEAVSERNLGCYAWYRADAENHTHPIGQKKPNLWGLYDMAGNVWEWCQDWYAPDYYARSPAQDPVNNQPAVERVFRGGSWSPTGAISARLIAAAISLNSKANMSGFDWCAKSTRHHSRRPRRAFPLPWSFRSIDAPAQSFSSIARAKAQQRAERLWGKMAIR